LAKSFLGIHKWKIVHSARLREVVREETPNYLFLAIFVYLLLEAEKMRGLDARLKGVDMAAQSKDGPETETGKKPLSKSQKPRRPLLPRLFSPL
jgi:hypothetical protein